MQYNFNGKNIRIPDDDIQRTMKSYGLTQEEAIQVWLEDEGYEINEEQEELEKKAKENKILHKATAMDKPKRTNSRKGTTVANPTKELIIAKTAEFLEEFAEDVTITNKGKMIHFKMNGHEYDFNLIQKREPKK